DQLAHLRTTRLQDGVPAGDGALGVVVTGVLIGPHGELLPVLAGEGTLRQYRPVVVQHAGQGRLQVGRGASGRLRHAHGAAVPDLDDLLDVVLHAAATRLTLAGVALVTQSGQDLRVVGGDARRRLRRGRRRARRLLAARRLRGRGCGGHGCGGRG